MVVLLSFCGHVYEKVLFLLQDYDLKDFDSVANVVKHSNCVINLVGRQFETRCAMHMMLIIQLQHQILIT